MASEIERKFVVAAFPAEAAGAPAVTIEQGYLAIDAEFEVRLRRAGGERILTVKRGHGERREEVEIRLYAEQFEALWPLTEGRRLRKTRHRLALGEGLVAEVDRYAGEREGLVVAEVEFPSPEASRAFRPPPWLGREVTGDPAYANQTLAMNGSRLDGEGEKGETGPSPMYHHGSTSFKLETDEPAPTGLQRIAAGRAEQAREKLGEVEQEGAAAIHRARKDLKKLRSVLRLVRARLGEKAYRAQNRRFRDAGRLLSDTRDAAVKVETLDGLEARFGEDFPSAVAEHWRRDLERERYAATADAGGEVAERVAQAVAAIDRGREEIAAWELRKDSWKLVAPGVLKAYAEGRAAMAEVRAAPSDDGVHEWRKRGKDLWYQLRILRELWPEVLSETAEQAHELTDRLGDHHDLAVLAADLETRDTTEPQAIEELIERRQAELLSEAIAIGERLYAEKPKAFGRRLEAYWNAARA